MGTSQSGPCADDDVPVPVAATISRESGVNDLVDALAALDRRLKTVESVAGSAVATVEKFSERLDAIDGKLGELAVGQERTVNDLKDVYIGLTGQLRELGEVQARVQVKQRAMIALLDEEVSPVRQAAQASGCHLGATTGIPPVPASCRRKMRM